MFLAYLVSLDTLISSMEPDVSFSPTDLTQKEESMAADTSIAADAEKELLFGLRC